MVTGICYVVVARRSEPEDTYGPDSDWQSTTTKEIQYDGHGQPLYCIRLTAVSYLMFLKGDTAALRHCHTASNTGSHCAS